MNLLEGTLERQNGGHAASSATQRLELDPEALAAHPALEGYVGRDVIVGIRPEHLEDAALATGRARRPPAAGDVVLREALGSEIIAHIGIDAKAALTEDVRSSPRTRMPSPSAISRTRPGKAPR